MEIAVVLPDELLAGFNLIGVPTYKSPAEIKEEPYLVITMEKYYKELRRKFPRSVVLVLDDSKEFEEIHEMIKMTMGRDLEVE